MSTIARYKEKIYAGVLGKIIGVYLGRAVEGWTYEDIIERFGAVEYYVCEQLGMPLIVPDDDISGTFVFYRALEDNGYPPDISAKQIGDTWLNYVIEDKTILWWGGLSRSTEHSAYIRLKSGIPAPKSGSTELNGQSMAEQIGAQIFIDTWAMVNPNDPDRAVKMAREAASVSHDGLAVEAACYLAAIEAMAFEERDVEQLIERGLSYTQDRRLLALVNGIVDECHRADDWRDVRNWIARNHGYDKYPGNCPMATNHVVVLMALIMGGDDFQQSVSIAASAGWDTDCNAGNVGCLNGIRLGLTALDAGAPLRAPVSDRMFVVSADGGECISDAVIESRKLIKAAAALRKELIAQPSSRYEFEFAGSTQGFQLYPDAGMTNVATGVQNARAFTGNQGLMIQYEGLARGVTAAVSVQTFVDPEPKGMKGTSYFEVLASPTLYPTQTVQASVEAYDIINPDLNFFIDYYDESGQIATLTGTRFPLPQGITEIMWQVPDTNGHPIYRLGIQLTSSTRLNGAITVINLDWSGAPEHFLMGKSMVLSPSLTPWTTDTSWMKMFVSSAKNLAPDYTTTLSVSHPEPNGVVTIGTRDWCDYEVVSRLTFSQQRTAGLVGRARGHRRYYAAVIREGTAAIVKRKDSEITTLATGLAGFQIDDTHTIAFRVEGGSLTMLVDGKQVAQAFDSEYVSGAAGFLVDEGAILCDGFSVKRVLTTQ